MSASTDPLELAAEFPAATAEQWQALDVEPYPMYRSWTFFMGYRFAVFNFATQALGGYVALEEFGVELVEPFD